MMAQKPETRRHDLDWLRVFAMLGVFYFHCTNVFYFRYWVENSEKALVFGIMAGFFDTWQMPLFFVISGAGSWFALGHRRAGAYVWDRVKRLAVPFYGAGVLFFIPLIYYWQEVSHGLSQDSFSQLYPKAFTIFNEKHLTPMVIVSPSFFALSPVKDTAHYWFLYSLFFISLAGLPLMMLLKSERGKTIIDRLARLCQKRGGVFLLIVPLYLFKVTTGIGFNGNFHWPEQFHYFFCFLFGYVMVADPRFVEAFKRDWWIAAIIGMAAYVCACASYMTSPPIKEMVDNNSYTLGGLVFIALLLNLTCWGLIVAFLGLAGKYFRHEGPVLNYANDAVLPFYIVHLAAIIGVGYYVTPLALPLMIKFIIILVAAFILSVGFYELLIRRFNPMRVLFGMRLKKKPVPAEAMEGELVES